ncbi:MAG: hypothetical protein GXN95_05765 [Methanococci archaeon]|nr:hypothetical protein [Methanococci archaeon]
MTVLDNMVSKLYSAVVRTVKAKESDDIYDFDDSKFVEKVFFSISNVEDTDKENVRITIHAGTRDRTFFDGTLTDLLMISYLQNSRNIIDTTNKTYKSLIAFDYSNDLFMTPLAPYLTPVKITVSNTTANDLTIKLGFEGVDSEDVVDTFREIYKKATGKSIITDNELKTFMQQEFKKRRFLSRTETLTATEQGFQIPAGAGIYDRIIIYTISGNIEQIKFTGLDTIIEENDMDTLTSVSLLENNLNPSLAPSDQIAILEGLPANVNYQLRIWGETGTKFKILLEKVV